jgi:hypothetical protein
MNVLGRLTTGRFNMLRLRFLVAGMVAATVCAGLAPGARAATGPAIQEGVLNGVPYRIAVPANWNGVLLVYADFYRDKADHQNEMDDRTPHSTIPTVDAQRQPVDTESLLLSKGYALAGTPYSDNGWVVKQGVSEVPALERYFESSSASRSSASSSALRRARSWPRRWPKSRVCRSTGW